MTQPISDLDPATTSVAEAPAVGPSGTAEHRARRHRRLQWSVLTSFLARALSIGIPLISLPLFVAYLGPEGFGLYESVGSLVLWLGLTNIGLNMGLQNRLQDCFVSGDREQARRYVSSMTLALAAMAVVSVALLSAVTPLVNWAAVFPTKIPRPAGETAWAVWVAGMIVLIGIATSIPYAVYAAYQESHVANLWEAVAKVVTLAACVLVVWTPFGLIGTILASSGVILALRILNAAWFFGREKPWLRPSPRLFDRGLLRVTLSEGAWLFVLQMATALIFHVDKLIIGNRLGAEAVAGYAIVGRLLLTAYAFFVVFQASLWPAYGEAIRRGDVAWARRAIGLMMAFSSLGMAAAGAVLYVWRGPIIAFAARGQVVEVDGSLIIAVTAFFIVRALAECQSVPLNAAGIIRPQIAVLGSNGVLNVAIALLLVRRYGVLGVAWAFPISAALTSLWAYPLLIRRYLRPAPVGEAA